MLISNRNKKSIRIDIKSNSGQEILHKLIAESDVVLNNFIPDTLQKYKLDFDHLRHHVNRSLIYCSITGFGDTGPYRLRNGYDLVIQALGGMMHITGTEETPCKTGVALIDIITGLYAQNAILSAIISRNREIDEMKNGNKKHSNYKGTAQKIDVNLFECCVSSLANIGSNYLIGNMEAKRWGTAHPNVAPYQAFKCRDAQYLVVGIGNDTQFAHFVKLMDLESLSDDDRFRHNKDRVENREILIGLLSEQFMRKSRTEWMGIFEGESIPNAPINNMEQVFNDPHLKERGLVKTVKHPVDGDIQIVGSPVRYSQCAAASEIRLHPPMLGEHNKEIICDLLGFDEAYLAEHQPRH